MENRADRKRSRLQHRLFCLMAGAAFLLLLAACGGGGEDADGAPAGGHDHQAHSSVTAEGDLQETTASLSDMPSFLAGESEYVKLSYAAAAKLKDTLRYIPCYCGCGESAGHRSSLNCFIAGVREDGRVVWDDHGARCGVCQQIALQSAKLKSEGSSDSDIRRFVDETYKEGYAKPTDTPLPPKV